MTDDTKILTTSEMIADLRMQARFIREETPIPHRIAEMIEDVAGAMEFWYICEKDKRRDA
jgi:hypothetical protein